MSGIAAYDLSERCPPFYNLELAMSSFSLAGDSMQEFGARSPVQTGELEAEQNTALYGSSGS